MEEEEVGNQKTRDFICACGKNYLSYAALFTHIKQKHDGKAPGPIVRPRSERKRGRPRKNPLNDQDPQNSDSDPVKNGISFINEINNNINLIQKKTKKAAQLLGCGDFQAFQAYRPETVQCSRARTQKQELKKVNLKKSASNIQKSQKMALLLDEPLSNQVPLTIKNNRSATSSNKDIKNDVNTYHYNFVIQHMKLLFKDYDPSEEEESCHQIIQIFDWIGQQISQQRVPISFNSHQNLTIQTGFQMFVQLLKDYLEDFQCKQVGFLLSLFYEYICLQVGKPSNLMQLGLEIYQFTRYIPSFLYQYLPQRISDLSVQCLFIFKNFNPTYVLMSLCNWLALNEQQKPESVTKSSHSFEKLAQTNCRAESKIIKKQILQQIKKYQKEQKTQKIEKSDSEDDIKFEQINYVLEKARLARQNLIKKEQQKLQQSIGETDEKFLKPGMKQRINKSESSQKSEYNEDNDIEYSEPSHGEEQMQNSDQQECLDAKNAINSRPNLCL